MQKRLGRDSSAKHNTMLMYMEFFRAGNASDVAPTVRIAHFPKWLEGSLEVVCVC